MVSWMLPHASLCVRAIAGPGAGISGGIALPRTRGDDGESTAQTRGRRASICFGEEGHEMPWRPHAYPGHVTDAEYSVDDVLVNVCGDKLHLDGPIAPRGLLGPVLHTELGQGKRSQEEAKDRGCCSHLSRSLSYCLRNTLAREVESQVGS